MMLNGTSIEDTIKSLETDCDALRDLKPRVNENFELLSTEHFGDSKTNCFL